MVSLLQTVPSRQIDLAGPGGCRDLGGYLTRTGEMVRWRRVLRADRPVLRSELGDHVTIAVGVGDGGVADVLSAVADADKPVVLLGDDDAIGLVAAVLLGVLGVGDGDIVRDHALTPGATAEAVRGMLLSMRLNHGSVTGYALDAGVDMLVIEVLRDRLLS
jgi:hypothetical protein